MVPADPIRFAAAARRLSAAARQGGLRPPTFRSPPRLPGARRAISRRPGGAAVVAVRLRSRSWEAVVTDMVEGTLVANRLPPARPSELRRSLLAAALGEGDEASAA